MYRELNRPQNNRDFGTYSESFPPYGDLLLCQILCLYHHPFRSYQH
jgi:hypothetical protein